MSEPALQPFTLPAGTLVTAAERFTEGGGTAATEVPSGVLSGAPTPGVGQVRDEVLTIVAAPVLRLALAARHRGSTELVGGWVGPELTVLLVHEFEPGLDRVIPVATEHLPLHLALLVDLRPRPVVEDVAPIQMPAAALRRILDGHADEPLPPTLPDPWGAVLRHWGTDPPVVRSFTVGRPDESPRDADADTREAAGYWRTISIIDDPASGLWLADADLLPEADADTQASHGTSAVSESGTEDRPEVVRVRPTRSHELVDLFPAMLRVDAAEGSA